MAAIATARPAFGAAETFQTASTTQARASNPHREPRWPFQPLREYCVWSPGVASPVGYSPCACLATTHVAVAPQMFDLADADNLEAPVSSIAVLDQGYGDFLSKFTARSG
jgi:hypothetical protein